MSQQIVQLSATERNELLRHGRRLEYLTIAYGVCECVVGILAGMLVGSVALTSFGFDSAIEVASGSALLWRLRDNTNALRREETEARSLRIVGICFLLLAAYVCYEAITSLIKRESPQPSAVGIAIAVLSLVLMPLLARAKRKVARGIESAALAADARQTDFCAYLAAILLAGLLLNVIFAWWWADAAAALLMTPIIAREGLQALRGETCGGENCH